MADARAKRHRAADDEPSASTPDGKRPAPSVVVGVPVHGVLAAPGPLPKFAGAISTDADPAARKAFIEDEAAKRAWQQETEAAVKRYDEQWLAERLPSAEWLADGARHVADQAMPIFRIVGEFSACQLMTRRLGAPTNADAKDIRASSEESERTQQAWRRLCDADWMDPIIEQEVGAAPVERKAGVREELREMQLDLQFSESPRVPLLRRFAQAMYPCKDDLARCQGWDTHLRRGEAYCKVEVTARLLATAVDLVIREGLVPGYRQTECPIDFHEFAAPCEGRVTWRSLHPCMHWVCEPCASEWINSRLQRSCPVCRAPIQFTRRLVRTW